MRQYKPLCEKIGTLHWVKNVIVAYTNKRNFNLGEIKRTHTLSHVSCLWRPGFVRFTGIAFFYKLSFIFISFCFTSFLPKNREQGKIIWYCYVRACTNEQTAEKLPEKSTQQTSPPWYSSIYHRNNYLVCVKNGAKNEMHLQWREKNGVQRRRRVEKKPRHVSNTGKPICCVYATQCIQCQVRLSSLLFRFVVYIFFPFDNTWLGNKKKKFLFSLVYIY